MPRCLSPRFTCKSGRVALLYLELHQGNDTEAAGSITAPFACRLGKPNGRASWARATRGTHRRQGRASWPQQDMGHLTEEKLHPHHTSLSWQGEKKPQRSGHIGTQVQEHLMQGQVRPPHCSFHKRVKGSPQASLVDSPLTAAPLDQDEAPTPTSFPLPSPLVQLCSGALPTPHALCLSALTRPWPGPISWV